MSFYVNLYSFAKKQNSTAQPTGTGTQYQCVSNKPFDVLHPSIPLNLGNAANPTAYNYCKIPDFQNRFYWIRTWTWEDGLWVAHCDADPLASWKPEIGALSGYVLRSAAEWDGTVVDTMYPQKVDSTFSRAAIASPWTIDPTQGSYVVGIVCSSQAQANAGGGVRYFTMTWAEYLVFFSLLTSKDYATDALGFYAITNPDVIPQLRPLQYVTSVIWLPFAATQGTVADHIYVGNVDVPYIDGAGLIVHNISTNGYDSIEKEFTLQKHPVAATRGNYLSASMSEYKLTVPPFGTFTLDPSIIADAEKLRLTIDVDHRTGAATMYVDAYTTGEGYHTLSRMTGQVGINVQLSSVMSPGMSLASVMQPAIAGVSSLMGMGTSQSAGGMMNGLSGLAGAAGSYLASAAQTKIPSVNTVGGTPSVSNIIKQIALDYVWYMPTDDDVTDKGRPLCKVKRLDTLPGYQLVGDVHVDIPCTEEEKNIITATLTGGYYYE